MEQKDIEYLGGMPTGFITDGLSRLGLGGWMDQIYPITQGRPRVFGRAVTVRFAPKRGEKPFPGNFYTVSEQCGSGDVLIVAALGTSSWILGDNTVNFAHGRGLSGIVIDGCIRDSTEISQIDIPLFARGASVRPFAPSLELAGYQEPVMCAGAQVNPGDIVVGDADGVVVIPASLIPDVVKQVRDIEALEEEQGALIAQGKSASDLADVLKRKKVLKK